MNREPMPPTFLLAGVIDELEPGPRQLVHDVMDLLHRNEMRMGMTELVGAVLGHVPDVDEQIRRQSRIVDDAGQLQPFAELLLMELKSIAEAPGTSTDRRESLAIEAIKNSGF